MFLSAIRTAPQCWRGRPYSLIQVMTSRALYRRLLLPMAIHALRHFHWTRRRSHFHFRHRAMARLAFHARLHMRPVAPEHERRDRRHPHPRDRPLQFRQLLNCRLIAGDGRVTSHAFRRGRQRHRPPRIGIRMTILALRRRRRMRFVAERHRLLRRPRDRNRQQQRNRFHARIPETSFIWPSIIRCVASSLGASVATPGSCVPPSRTAVAAWKHIQFVPQINVVDLRLWQ